MSGFESIKRRVEKFSRGRIFFPEDFSALGSSDMIRSALVRLCEDGIIIRLGQGIYYYPVKDDKWGMGILYPSVEKIAKAIAKRYKYRIAPTGTAALNILGLSTQLQANVVYYTDGSARRINIGNGHGILFKRSNEMKRFAYKSELMQLIVVALREIGNGKVSDDETEIIAARLKEVKDEDFIHDVALAPAWVQKLLKSIR